MSLSVFSFIETFFFLSLAISFVLILLLVYHFKQRISVLEHKNETMVRIMSDVMRELDLMKRPEGMMMPDTCYMSSFTVPFDMGSPPAHQDAPSYQVEEVTDEYTPAGFSQSDDEDDEDDTDDEEEESDDDAEEPGTATAPTYDIDESVPKIVVSDSEAPSVATDVAVSTETADYRKMNLQSLKQLAVSKGLVADASKMKKPDLVALFFAQQGHSA